MEGKGWFGHCRSVAGRLGAKGSEGVSTTVAQTAGSISYVEYSYVVANKMGFSKMKNAAGKVVEPKLDTFAAAAAAADWKGSKNFNVMITNQPGDATWPIAASPGLFSTSSLPTRL